MITDEGQWEASFRICWSSYNNVVSWQPAERISGVLNGDPVMGKQCDNDATNAESHVEMRCFAKRVPPWFLVWVVQHQCLADSEMLGRPCWNLQSRVPLVAACIARDVWRAH